MTIPMTEDVWRWYQDIGVRQFGYSECMWLNSPEFEELASGKTFREVWEECPVGWWMVVLLQVAGARWLVGPATVGVFGDIAKENGLFDLFKPYLDVMQWHASAGGFTKPKYPRSPELEQRFWQADREVNLLLSKDRSQGWEEGEWKWAAKDTVSIFCLNCGCADAVMKMAHDEVLRQESKGDPFDEEEARAELQHCDLRLANHLRKHIPVEAADACWNRRPLEVGW